ncbi:transcriptional regulator, TetR family [Pirellula staleyi DSM 6068]|uniref:Transcriptional regulator, TetR family n=1 Tax=Pirellula staleyi (strain ATCC 27377 / DSM 6068 / ICPB 4128) TaxID=530564 RepID=D2R875_PIRSD|nr:TetR/AcrR family transcriptional regulator [Pirellula staleyi]ADB15692.1 transcriptional regulator, TetR family [Pirellula staleyi DSM 6068]
MSTLTRKQREIREREQLILDISRRMLVEQGYAGLSMDRLADQTEYSKGVIYQHFASKEDLVMALAVQSAEARTQLFERATKFEGRPRERMLAIGVAGELFIRLHPYHAQSEQIVKMAGLDERATPERRSAMLSQEGCCFGVVKSVVDDAVQVGDLQLPASLTTADIVLALWALNFGGQAIIHTDRDLLVKFGITMPYNTIRMHCQTLLDGYGWRPLFTEWDYEATYRRILRDLFAEESLAAGMA